MSGRTIRVLCADDHGFLIDGLEARFGLERDLECVGRLASADDLITEARRLRPDIVMLDIEMPGRDPFDVAEILLQLLPETRVVFLSAYVRDHFISTAIDIGASGYFSKSDEPQELIDGLRRVMRAEVVFSRTVKERIKPMSRQGIRNQERPSTKLESLTPREREILRFIGRGLQRAAIAESACISPKTVDNHREAIMRKLDIHDRAELVRFSISEGLAAV